MYIYSDDRIDKHYSAVFPQTQNIQTHEGRERTKL